MINKLNFKEVNKVRPLVKVIKLYHKAMNRVVNNNQEIL